VLDAGGVLHAAFHAPDNTTVARTTGQCRVGQADIVRLQATRAQLKAMDDSLGGGAAYPLASDYLRREVRPMLNGCYSDHVGRELYGIAAQLTLDLGWMAYDAGHQAAAREHMLRALELARAGQHRLFGGRVLSALSHQALHLGEVAEAVDMASAALAGAAHLAPPTALAMFAAMKACALADHHRGVAAPWAWRRRFTGGLRERPLPDPENVE
jgi:hypothetical protein